MVATNSRPAWRRALLRLYSCTWCLRPPTRNDAPSMNSVLVTIAPAMEALTSTYCPARNAAKPMSSSVRLPSVALSKPPIMSRVRAATDSVAWLNSAANGTMAATESTNRRVWASGLAIWARRTTGTSASSHSSGLRRISRSRAITVSPAVCERAGTMQSCLRPLAQIDEPIHGRDHDGAADQVTDRHRKQISNQEIAQGQGRKIGRGLADRTPERGRRVCLYEQTHGNEIGVSDAVLETGGSKGGDRRNDRKKSIDRRPQIGRAPV